jgi:hypothetical protein
MLMENPQLFEGLIRSPDSGLVDTKFLLGGKKTLPSLFICQAVDFLTGCY